MPSNISPATNQIWTGGFQTCAVNANSYKCWGANSGEPHFHLPNPTQISVGYNIACALTDEGIRFWGMSNRGEHLPPADLKNVSQIAVCHCAIANGEAKCWGGQSKIPPIVNPSQISYSVTDEACAVTAKGLVC